MGKHDHNERKLRVRERGGLLSPRVRFFVGFQGLMGDSNTAAQTTPMQIQHQQTAFSTSILPLSHYMESRNEKDRALL